MRFTDENWKPRYLKFVPTKEKLTDASGLGAMVEAFDQSRMSKEFAKCLPKRSSHRSHGSYRLGLIQLSSFLYGHDCLDDLEEFQEDPSLSAVMRGETAAPRTMGDFLRDFEDEHISALNLYLPQMAKKFRTQLISSLPQEYKPQEAPIMDIDSTDHEQSGEKMEGLAWNYKEKWCLDSQVVFDELGFNCGMQLRSGNTKSGVNAGELIRSAFSAWKKEDEKYLRADSAYCNQEVIRTCLDIKSHFTITATDATTRWESHIGEITNWKPWEYSEEDKKKAVVRNHPLPKVELGTFLWTPGWAESIRFLIIVKRTWVEKQNGTLFDIDTAGGYWDHYGIVAGMPMQKFTVQQVVEHHNKRGNGENFIREEKYGYDLKHFPCLKLKANYAFGLLAMVAHNILRWMAVLQRPDKPHFSKKLRRRFIHIPGKVVEHARTLCVKIPERFYKEVMRLRKAWQCPLDPATGFS